MSALVQILKEGVREVITTAIGAEIRDRIKGRQDGAENVSREQLLAFIEGLNKEAKDKIMAWYQEYEQKGEGDRFVRVLTGFLSSLKQDGLDETKIKEIFVAYAELSPKDLELRLKFLERKGAVVDTLKNLNQELESVLDPIVEQIKKVKERRISNRYVVK